MQEFCNYCKEKGHDLSTCEKLMRKREREAKFGKKPFSPCPHCKRENPYHTPEKCWSNPKLKNSSENKKQNNRESQANDTKSDSQSKQSTSKSSQHLN